METKFDDKIIVTNFKDNCITGFNHNGKFYDLNIEKNDADTLGSIYVGLLKDSVKNINAAFVEYQQNKKGYLAIRDNQKFIKFNNKNPKLCEGDYVLVQIIKDRQKTKDAVLTTEIEITGRYLVLTFGKPMVAISGKIKNNRENADFCDKIKELLTPYVSDDYGFIVRTQSLTADFMVIEKEAKQLIDSFNELVSKAQTRPVRTCIFKANKSHLRFIEERYKDSYEIVTDDKSIYDEIVDYFSKNPDFPKLNIRFYEDKLQSLFKLYSLGVTLNQALNKKVWLKSGGYLYIEPTEAMTVIDVNTGKVDTGKNNIDTFFKINKEAAFEIARQLRLRNVSGIIIIDFIDMPNEDYNRDLINYLNSLLFNDPIKTNFVDMTKLGLVELTRKKTMPSIYETIKLEDLN